MVSDKDFKDLQERVEELEKRQYSNLDIEALIESIPAQMIVPPVRTKEEKIKVSDLEQDETGNSDSESLDDRYVNAGGDTNITGDLVSQERFRPTKIWHVYGGFQNIAITIACTLNQWAKVTNSTGNLFQGAEADGFDLSNDTMLVKNAGDYIGFVGLAISALQGKDYFLRIYNLTQGVQMGYRLGATTTGANNYQIISLPLYLECDKNDRLELEIMNVTDGTDPVVRSCVFYLAYLHE